MLALARAVRAAIARHAPVDAAIAIALDVVESGLADRMISHLRELPRPESWVSPTGYQRWLAVLDGHGGWWEDTLPVALVPSRLVHVAQDRERAAEALALIADPDGVDAVFRIERWAVLSGGLRAGELLAGAPVAA